ncbi:MAG: sulfatase [Deltaproteobacteria bacterium]|nr:sulfatase [Deltaproteobacteria bacterium]
MNHRLLLSVITASVIASATASLLAGCGKGTKDQGSTTNTTTDPKVAESGAAPATKPDGTPAKPDVAPVKAAARGPEHAVYSLVDNRLSAHLTRGGGLLVPAGSAGFAKYIRFANVSKGGKKAWELRQKEGDVPVARLAGKSASVFVPLTAAQAGRNTLRMRLFAKEAGTMSLRVNENKDVNTAVEQGWSTIEVAIPEGQIKEGENAFQFFMKSSGNAVAWLQIGAKAPVADDGATAFYDAAQKAVLVPKEGQLSWFVMMPDKAKLTADLADGSCQVAVLATAEDGATVEGKLVGIGSAVDLAALSGKATRLDLETSGCAQAAVANAALVVPGEAPQVAQRGEAPKYVLFIIMDSLRADRVKPFNPKARPEAPTFEKLAESSSLFLQHYVQGNESQVSHASMWTSMYLAKHKALKMGDKLPERYVTIDDVAKKAGMFVAGVSANGYIRPARGFGTSWDKYVNHIESKMGLKGVDIIEKGMSFITPKKDQPWFLYLGMIDTHVTWRAKQPWMDKYDGGYKGRFQDSFGDDGPGGFAKDLTDREKDHVRALYDSNVSYQDDLLGKLIEKLQAWGIWDQTMLIITAAHGDAQWEDGRVGHAGSQKQTLIHVPLLVRYPPMFPAAKIESGTEGIDITPTLADALGVAIDPEWQGMSLVGLANGTVGYPLLASSSQYENFHGGRIGHWKIRLAGSGTPQLYNLAKDSGEKKDLWGTPGSGIAARLLLDPMWQLRNWNAEWKKSQWGNAAVVSSRFAADLGE